jgi:leucyl aminopeptidase (aminopeptidase T)
MSTLKHRFAESEHISAELQAAAKIAIQDSLKVKEGDQVIIITNPDPEVSLISKALYDAALDAKGRPIIMYQPSKTQLDFAEPSIIAMFEAKPEVVISMSAEKLGKDQKGIVNPYVHQNKKWDNIFHLHMYGYKTCRSFWSPGTTIDSFVRTVPIDYALLRKQCKAVKDVLDKAVAIHITAPAGTDVTFGLKGRLAFSDDGDFSAGGEGGNLPAGETFISPENNTAEGVIVYDGSISLHDKTILIQDPIYCKLEKGFITDISGGKGGNNTDAEALLETVTLGEKNAIEFEAAGKLEKGAGAVYAKNARGIGEIGIGLNPKARIIGNMLEDEKAFRTCHFAIGSNYDDDSPALIHLDGLVKEPTIIAIMEDGSKVIIEDKGNLAEQFLG